MPVDKINQTIRLKDGRALGFAEYGDRSDKVVFHFNGFCGSRLEHPIDKSILMELGIRLISTDRPGHGLSDPQANRKLLDWPDDISQLANHLGVDRFYVMGWSAGATYALACAYKLPERVLAGATISGLAPPACLHPYDGTQLSKRVFMFGAWRAPTLIYPLRRMAYRTIMGDAKGVGKKLTQSLQSVDRELIKTPENLKWFTLNIMEGYRQGWQGPAQDDTIIHNPWGFSLENITMRIDIW